ncbi:MAG: zinc-binding alcohol dehydrogenase [Erysipelotrichaceae bacterium]|nr:zinc-binding alcohol dehydrogenase [Erysipelotrichaceae bacterium]
MLSKFVIITGKGLVECQTEEVSDKDLKPNEAIIETEASLISAGTELSRVFAIKEGFSYPVRPGYSAIGRIISKGEGLTDLQVGDHVFYSGPHASVNRYSRSDKTQGPKIFKIPDDMNPYEGSLICLGLVAMNGVNATEIKLGDTLAVFGLGTIGMMAALLYQELGARVIAVDPVRQRCALAKELGIREVLDCAPAEQIDALRALTNGRGVDIAVDVTGVSPAIENVILSCGLHGQVVLLGSPRAAYTTNVTNILNHIHMKMIKVIGAFNNLNPVFEKEGSRICVERDFKVVCDRIYDKRLDAGKIISHVIKPEEAQEAYHGLMYDKEVYRCVVIDWQK